MREYGMPWSIRVVGLVGLICYLGAVSLPILWYLEMMPLELPVLILATGGVLIVGAFLHGLASLIRSTERIVRAIERTGPGRTIDSPAMDSNQTLTNTSLSDEEVFGGLYKGQSDRGTV